MKEPRKFVLDFRPDYCTSALFSLKNMKSSLSSSFGFFSPDETTLVFSRMGQTNTNLNKFYNP